MFSLNGILTILVTFIPLMFIWFIFKCLPSEEKEINLVKYFQNGYKKCPNCTNTLIVDILDECVMYKCAKCGAIYKVIKINDKVRSATCIKIGNIYLIDD